MKKPANKRPVVAVKKSDASGLTPDLETISVQGVEFLARVTTLWIQGDWENLTKIDSSSLVTYAERARLALLVASGHLQCDHTDEAEKFIALAQEWGAETSEIACIILSGAYNSLACAISLSAAPRRGLSYFKKSLAIVKPSSEFDGSASIRKKHQLTNFGLIPGTAGRLQNLEAFNDLSFGLSSEIDASFVKEPVHESSLRQYKKIADKYPEEEPAPFVLIDSKSLPRSGLHYLKNTFSKLLGDQFSFCEWYQEVGCCKKHPCSLLCYAEHAEKSGKFRLRLIKSHDFSHADPAFPTSKILRRLVLVRDPLFILTSWFELDQMTNYRSLLMENGIDMQKLWLMHEKELLTKTKEIVSSAYKAPTADDCKAWLVDKSNYIIHFINHWVAPYRENKNSQSELVFYDEINQYIIDTLSQFRLHLSDASVLALDKFTIQKNESFVKRNDPFSLTIRPIEKFIRDNSNLFSKSAELIGHKTGNLFPISG